jgi:transcription antitermination factor NusG
MVGASQAADPYHTRGWYACRTRPRAEKRAGQLLKLRGMESYVPLLEQERRWSDRTKRVAFPLFPGYVFGQFSLAMVHDVLRTPGVVTIVRNDGNPAPVRREELESIRVLVGCVNAGNAPPEPAEFLETGQEVIVAQGPFSGIRGVLVEDRGRTRVVIRLTALRRALSVELPREILRAAVG